MLSAESDQIDWGTIGKPLEALLKYERKLGHYEQASNDLVSTVVHAAADSEWRRFLLEGQNLNSVVGQVIAISDGNTATPKAALDSIRELVDAAATDGASKTSSFTKEYLEQRPHFPAPVRERLDRLVKDGDKTIPLAAVALASELDRLNSGRAHSGAEHAVFNHWYQEILEGRVTARQAQGIPSQVQAARDRLIAGLREIRGHEDIDEDKVHEWFPGVFRSDDIDALADLVIGARRLGQMDLGLQVEQLEQFMKTFSKEEVMRRLTKLSAWMDRVNRWQNHFGVLLTPMLTEYLAREDDFDSLLAELDRLMEETSSGRFRIDNPLQKELEYKRFVSVCESNFIHPSTYPKLLLVDPPPDPADMPRLFTELQELPPPIEEEYSPDDHTLLEIKRAAYEAAVFLEMLREFRARTSRPIMVLGNDRYGRQWAVEPIEDYLGEGFTTRYAKVHSGASMRLTVPSPFPREFVREINEVMPHIVIADGANWPYNNPYGRERQRRDDFMRFSRALRGYANWFMVFNDIRAEGDMAKYVRQSCLPPDHISELRDWYEFTALRQELGEWVDPGQTYRVGMWAPLWEEQAMFGDMDIDVDPEEPGGDEPLVVIATPNIYRDEGDDLPSVLRATRPYFFDEPNAKVRESIEIGFGPHGFTTHHRGPTTASYVAVVQRHIKAEVGRLLETSSGLRAALH